MVGIKDIAKEAGVSISTVSYALNGSPKVTEETRKKIKTIANKLNYVPNMAARTLKKQETKLIGVYLSDYGGSFYGELLAGIKQGLFELNYEMIVCSGKKSHLFLPERMIDGVIVLDWTFKTQELISLSEQMNHIVVLDRDLSHKNICSILLDNRGGATLAIERMIEQGSRFIHLIVGPEKSYDSKCRLEACKKELNRFSVPFKIMQGNFTEASGYSAAKEIMSEKTELPIDIFAFNDEMAVGVYRYFKETNFVIGKDIRIIGFDNNDIGEFIEPSLTTISYSKHRWGMIASEKVVQLIQKKEIENECIYSTLVVRDSF